MLSLIVSMFAFLEFGTPTIVVPAPNVPGGQVVILRDRQKMKEKGGECPKHVVIMPKQ